MKKKAQNRSKDRTRQKRPPPSKKKRSPKIDSSGWLKRLDQIDRWQVSLQLFYEPDTPDADEAFHAIEQQLESHIRFLNICCNKLGKSLLSVGDKIRPKPQGLVARLALLRTFYAPACRMFIEQEIGTKQSIDRECKRLMDQGVEHLRWAASFVLRYDEETAGAEDDLVFAVVNGVRLLAETLPFGKISKSLQNIPLEQYEARSVQDQLIAQCLPFSKRRSGAALPEETLPIIDLGARWSLSKSGDTVTDLLSGKCEKVKSLEAQAYLRVLRRLAPSEDQKISIDNLKRAVFRELQFGSCSEQNPAQLSTQNPAQIFRRTREGSKAAYAFYGVFVKNDGRLGNYWLQFK